MSGRHEIPPASARVTIAWLWELWRPFRSRIFIIMALTFASAALRVGFPYLHQYIIDGLARGGDVASVAVAVVVTGVLRSVVNGLLQYQRASTNLRLERAARERLFARAVQLGPDALERHPTGDLLARLSDDCGVEKTGWFGCSGVFRTVEATLVILTALAALIAISPWTTLASVLPIPAIAIVFLATAGKLDRLYANVQARVSALEAFLDALFTGMPVVKAYSLGAAHVERFRALAQAHRDAEVAAARGQQGVEVLHGFGWQFAIVAFIVAGGVGVLNGSLTLGQFISFEEIVLTLAWPALDWGAFFVRLRQAGASVARIEEVANLEPEVRAPANGAAPDLAGGLAFEGVTRQAKTRRLLDDVSFAIPRGALVAIVGRIGSGKSTLLRMLPRILDPSQGRVAASGADLRALDLAAWRARGGYVPQDASLVSATIEENIRLGRDDLPASAIEKAVKDARLSNDLDRFEKGLATRVGERGVTLSGGQKARVALARALAHDPEVLVLDDVSAALDAQTETQVFEALSKREGRTTVVATHRPETLERAARVLVLDEGKVVDQGSHHELLDRCGLYREIWARARLEALERR